MKTYIRNPYQRALVTFAGLTVSSLLATLLIWILSSAGFANSALTWIGFVLFMSLDLIWFIIWLLGVHQVRLVKTFLESDRPVLRWSYSAVEWKQYKEAVWQGESGDWKVQWGCMTFLLALAGLITGSMLGLEGGFLEVIINGLIGLVLGSLAGAVLGALVAGGNYWGARQAYRQSEPGQVALGSNEIYANNDYFKGNKGYSYIREAKIHRGNPTTLEVQLVFPPRPRMPSEEQWLILIPSQWVERVEEILPVLMKSI